MYNCNEAGDIVWCSSKASIHNTSKTIMVPLRKKPNATTCKYYRTINLLMHASKIVERVLTKRIKFRAETDDCIGEDQYGFRKGKGTRNAIGHYGC